jgi:hypothetical protein
MNSVFLQLKCGTRYAENTLCEAGVSVKGPVFI